ncbi:putative nucleic acid-binding Zn-ribbon protein [Arthrobacter stackebrandtii]|uniref:Nucleic acid-binding Zn-ribbon protein n=1 Tax=Arthrobacter stackebrandtii TaxID=272161 RepID=A0ABS4YZE8_9MICC|nr:C4-type zinc ribbon domain-containing protein [Arthrobacter stackebrandtii]MBP2414166.1 putative nucleic acid-binding Zn-ribbon protein [Arthrobacter stackebrandtii]PYG98963.1 DNA-binding protein [Arthrobacter stackebrandtii]
MAKAAPGEQLRLLDIQSLDGKLRGLDVQAKALKEDPRLPDLHGGVTAAKSDQVVLDTAVGDAQRALTKAEDDVAAVVARIDRDEAKLNSGTGLSKDLMALQSEIESLGRRRSELEDTQLEAMEAFEEAVARQEAQRGLVEQMQSVLDEVLDEVRSKLAGLKMERDATLAERAELAATFDPALLAIYDRTLAKYGVGAARLFHGKSEGSGMELSAGDLVEIKKAAADTIVFCPDSGAILVRSEEWG